MKKFDFNDINLIPKKGIVDSRSECSTFVKLGNMQFKSPVIPANMSSVMTEELAVKLAKEGYFYIMHRFNTDSIAFAKMMRGEQLPISISIGVNEDSVNVLRTLSKINLEPEYITIDIAHGHCKKMKFMIAYIRSMFKKTFIIAGNVCTREGIFDLEQWGADAVKVGIAPGHACTTAMATGFGSRNCQASTIYDCAVGAKVPIIADGGIVHPADVTKALVLGASMVMCGNLVSGCKDSPGEIIWKNDIAYKEYWGSASQFESGKSNRIEGTKKLVEYKYKTLLEQMNFLDECLQSSISYAGGTKLEHLQLVRWH